MPSSTDGLVRIATAPLALPSGMRDLLPPRAHHRRSLARTLLTQFERYGYQLVIPPAFEREDVVSRGLSERARRDLVRFLEPETGDVMALRPDMTPQIARIAATRYRENEGPLRFMYEGTVVRRPRGRARRHRQIAQAGIECIGWADSSADLEVIRAAAGALVSAGLVDWRIELGHASIAEVLLRDVHSNVRDMVTDALAARDTATLSRILGSDFHSRSAMARAIELAGDASVLDRAERELPESEFRAPISALREMLDGLSIDQLDQRVLVDLAEVRGLGYYTGVAFQLLADGPGEPLGAGGRYDTLLERYGQARAATGCAIDLEHLEWALGHAEVPNANTDARILVGGVSPRRRSESERLRNQGLATAECSAHTKEELVNLARAGEYQRAVFCTENESLELHW